MSKQWSVTGQSVSALSTFDDVIQAFMEQNDMRNGVLAITQGTRLLLARGYTWAEPGSEVTQPTSLFRIASCTKPLTRIAIYQLVEAGLLRLSDKVQSILGLTAPDGGPVPSSPEPKDKNTAGKYFGAVTVEHLLSHSGGWDRGVPPTATTSDEPTFYKDTQAAAAFKKGLPVTRMELARWGVTQDMQFYPGSRTAYSNFGFALLGLVIEKKTGVDYMQRLHSALFSSLGVSRPRLGMPLERSRAPGEVAYFPSHEELKPDLTGGGGLVPIQYGGENNMNFASFGGWVMAAPDYARVLAAYAGKHWPTATHLRDMAGSPSGSLGGGASGTEHGGGLPGSTTYMALRNDGIGIVFFCNGDKSGSLRWAGKTQPLSTVLHQMATDKVASFPAHDLFPSVMTPPLPPGPEKLHVFTADSVKGIREATWEQNVAAAQWAGSWSMIEGRAPSGSPVTAVSRRRDQLDAFVVGPDQRIYTAAWRENTAAERWAGWWPILEGRAPVGAQVTPVARAEGKLDVFVVGLDGGVYTAAWDAAVPGGWRGWWRIGSLTAKAGSTVAAVARDPNKLDVFVVGADGKTYTAAWAVDMASGQWRGWWNILTGAAPSGGAVSAVSRHPNKLDVFLTSTDGHVYTAAWEGGVANDQWRGWWQIGSLTAKPGTAVAAVARDPNKLDVFVAGSDGKTYTAAWAADVASGQWRGWWNILTGAIPAGGSVSAVSRHPNKLDVFLISTDGNVYTAAWEGGVANGQWRGWWQVRDLSGQAGALVGAVVRKPVD
ncbi:beta-lactamase family protein [Hyalangium versicolor]|uniref:beta-lactamase family protein n=1 Tax=Hyalangium versicolor TaxID=2861190 RepID=UPI001CCFCE34|nr:beta-lactamase family protein [Hyalangium versicolor]